MAELTQDEVRHVAALAHIAVTDAEVERYRTELAAVLEHVAALAAVPTDDVAPLQHITEMTNVLRPDRAQPADEATRDAIMAAVPQKDGDYIAVRVVQEKRDND